MAEVDGYKKLWFEWELHRESGVAATTDYFYIFPNAQYVVWSIKNYGCTVISQNPVADGYLSYSWTILIYVSYLL